MTKKQGGRNKAGFASVVGKEPPTSIQSQLIERPASDPSGGKLAPILLIGDGTIVRDVRGNRPSFMQEYADSEGDGDSFVPPSPDSPSGGKERGRAPSAARRYRVIGTFPRVNIGGMVACLKEGKIVMDNSYNIASLRSQGVKLAELDAPDDEDVEEEEEFEVEAS